MENNDHIDKHIKRSLEDLTVHPKYSSFDEVMHKLRKKKRRRFFFIILLPGLLILSGFATWSLVPAKAPIYTVKPSALKSNTETKAETKNRKSDATQKNNSIEQRGSDPEQKRDVIEKEKTNPLKSQSIKQVPNVNPYNINDQNSFTQNKDSAGIIQKSGPALSEVVKEDLLLIDSLIKIEELKPVSVLLPYDQSSIDIKTLLQESGYNNSKKDDEKDIPKFFIGLAFEPQLSSYIYSKNRNWEGDKTYQEEYVKHKWSENEIRFNYAYGIKTGMTLKEKWELQGGIGYQRFKYYETPMPGSTIAYAGNFGSQPLKNDPSLRYDRTYFTAFRYIWCTAEAAKYFTFANFIKLKAGVGIRMNYLWSTTTLYTSSQSAFLNPNRSDARKWVTSVNFKLGYVEDLGKRMQLQVCPNLFCTPGSMLSNRNAIKQRNVGAGLECLLLYKFN
jgi:hypothetical protein